VALDIGPAAIARLLAAMQERLRQSVLLINFGASKSYLTVIWGRRLMLDREIDFGEMQLVDRWRARSGWTAEVALALLREHGIGTPAGAPHQAGRRTRHRAHDARDPVPGIRRRWPRNWCARRCTWPRARAAARSAAST
jgi:type IV pilus assembly protein PilM